MGEAYPFTIEGFYAHLSQGKLMAARCKTCGSLVFPPRPICPKCLSTDHEWVELRGRGRLLTYTVIHVAPPQFQPMVPYIVGIVRLEDGVNMPGMIREADADKLKIGMEVELVVEAGETATGWPTWPKYYFRPVRKPGTEV